MFTKIDTWLLESNFQKFADWFRDRYGKTPFWLGSTCILLYTGFMLMKGVMKDQGPWAFAFDGIFVLLLLYLVWTYDRLDAAAQTLTVPAQSPYRHDPLITFMRLMCFGGVVLDLLVYANDYVVDSLAQKIALADTAQDFMAVAAYYFISCDIKPPRPRRKEKPAEAPTDAVSETT